MTDETRVAVQRGWAAYEDLRGEASLLAQTWEVNPQLSAMRAGAAALKALLELVEAA